MLNKKDNYGFDFYKNRYAHFILFNESLIRCRRLIAGIFHGFPKHLSLYHILIALLNQTVKLHNFA